MRILSTGDLRKLEVHEAAEIFPRMTIEQVAELAADIKTNGQRMPVLLFEGRIIDGRNRATACEREGIDCLVEDADLGGRTPLDFVLSMNLHRRHLTTSQRAIVAARVREQLAADGVEKRQAQLKKGTKNPEVSRGRKNAPTGNRASEEAAKLLNVSPRIVDKAAVVLSIKDSALTGAVERGELSVNMAEQIAKAAPEDREKVLRPPVSNPLAGEKKQPPVRKRAEGILQRNELPVDPLCEEAILAMEHLAKLLGRIEELFPDEETRPHAICRRLVDISDRVEWIFFDLPKELAKSLADSDEEERVLKEYVLKQFLPIFNRLKKNNKSFARALRAHGRI